VLGLSRAKILRLLQELHAAAGDEMPRHANGEGYRDEGEIRYLLKHLGIERYQAVLDVVGK